MKICDEHWEELKREVKRNGLWDFVAKDNDELKEQLTEFVETHDNEKIDPLWAASEMIMMQGMRCGGMMMLFPKEDGTEICPVCEAHSHGQTDWITGPVGAVRDMITGKDESSDTSIEGME